MGDTTSGLLKLRPVTFLYKPEYDGRARTRQYGLIAEEVAEIFPDLVVYDKDGAPLTVKYQLLAPMLLNELQRQHRHFEEQADVVKVQQLEIEDLKAQLRLQNASFQEHLSLLESAVSTQLKAASDKTALAPATVPGGGE